MSNLDKNINPNLILLYNKILIKKKKYNNKVIMMKKRILLNGNYN